MNIQDDISIVGDELFAPYRSAAKFDQLSCHMAAGHGDDLHRQWELAQYVHQFAAVCDADKLSAGACDDLLAGQRATTALDERQIVIRFICAIHIDIQLPRCVKIHYRNAVALHAFGRNVGT